jgi:hypothetical protein
VGRFGSFTPRRPIHRIARSGNAALIVVPDAALYNVWIGGKVCA